MKKLDVLTSLFKETGFLTHCIKLDEVVMRHFFRQLEAGEFQAVTSTLTLTEVLVHPIRTGNVSLAQRYR